MRDDLDEVSARDCRLALEALRNGVPNGAAVRMLGCNQEEVESEFRSLLDKAVDRQGGMLISGDFGSGKSHILTHLQHLALAENYVCSKVAVSKETPLYDLGKVFTAAVESARMPNRTGRLIEELAIGLAPDSEAYAAFFQWAQGAAASGALSPLFPATLAVHERSGDTELRSAIESFWAGDRILMSRVRAGLREIDEFPSYRFRAPRAAELPPQRLSFVLELIKGAGYDGWVVLLDELELVGSYSILQRGRSYAEVARWLGRSPASHLPGLAVAGTLTEDFASAIISADGKRDCDYIRPKLENNPRHALLAPLAMTGMRCLERECIALRPPTDQDVASTIERLRAIYAKAYGWQAPPLHMQAGGAGFQGRMRYKVRTAINQWDLVRLVPGARPSTEVDEFRTDYTEDPSRDPPDDSEQGPGPEPRED